MSASPRFVYLSKKQTLDEIAAYLKEQFDKSKIEVAAEDGELSIHFANWKIRIVDLRDSWIKDEAKEHAGRCKDAKKRATLEKSARRLELYEDDDPDEKHYNDGLLTFERLAGLPGAVGMDPTTGDFH